MFRAKVRRPAPPRFSSFRRTRRRSGHRPALARPCAAFADRLQDYPDGAATALREAIGARHGLDPASIVCGTGSDEILHLLAAAYIGPGDEGIFTEHGFLVYKIAILAAGGVPVVAAKRI